MEANDRHALLEAARESIDAAELQDGLEAVYEQELEGETILALREIAAEEIAVATMDAADRARRRARTPRAEDVAEAAEQRRSCCEGGSESAEPLFGVWETR